MILSADIQVETLDYVFVIVHFIKKIINNFSEYKLQTESMRSLSFFL